MNHRSPLNYRRKTGENQDTLSAKKEAEKLMLLRDISIWLDDYDEIFSDFDPRPYSQRVLSDDFILEIRKVCREKEETVDELKLLIPADKRNASYEAMIAKSLHSYFRKQFFQYKEQYDDLKKKGIVFITLGSIMMLVASYLSKLQSGEFHINVLFVIFEPSGWFILWSGLDMIFYTSKPKKKELEFFNKLSKSKITFLSI